MRNIDQAAALSPFELMRLAARIAWTPCAHYQKCVGFCPACFVEYLNSEEQETIQS